MLGNFHRVGSRGAGPMDAAAGRRSVMRHSALPAEAHRASLEQHLQQETKRLAAKYQIGVVQLPCVPKVRLPLSSEGVPELKLKSCNDETER